jgi:signal transduction histidine kinase
LALSIFRIVQESLTNVRKHANGSRCEVSIAYAPDALGVEVVDDGSGEVLDPDGPGFGIIGMCERARLYGGSLEAGPRTPDAGWAVRGRFPLDDHVVGS